MANLRLNRVSKGDSQYVFTNKVNANFSLLAEYFGGPNGKIGLIGDPGPQGNVGQIGTKGFRGTRGSVWFISAEAPLVEGDNILDGDFWVSVSASNMIYKLVDGEWVYQNINLKSAEQFKREFLVTGPSSKDALIQSSPNPITNTFVLNSAAPDLSMLNPQYSRMVIETSPGITVPFDQGEQPILELSKSAAGSTAGYDKSAIFKWLSPTTDSYNLHLDVRQGALGFSLGGGTILSANGGSVGMRSKKDSILLNINGLSITGTGDFYLRDFASTYAISLDSSNFKLGQGEDLDFASISSPLTVNRNTSGNIKPALSILNNIDTRGDGLHIEAEYASGSGNLWDSKIDGTSLLKVSKDGKITTTREIGIRKNPSASTEIHGSYSGTSYNWYGIFPSIAGGSSGTGRIDWDGDEDIVIDTTAGPYKAVYVNTYWIDKHFLQNQQSISFSVKFDTTAYAFEAVGMGDGETGTLYFPEISVTSEWDALASPAYTIDFHMVKYGDSTYNLFYEAYGLTGGIQTGILSGVAVI